MSPSRPLLLPGPIPCYLCARSADPSGRASCGVRPDPSERSHHFDHFSTQGGGASLSASHTDTNGFQKTTVQNSYRDALSPIPGRRGVPIYRPATGRAQSRKRPLTCLVLQIPHRSVPRCLMGTAEEVEHSHKSSIARGLDVSRDGQSRRRTRRSPSFSWVTLCSTPSPRSVDHFASYLARRVGKINEVRVVDARARVP